MSEMATCLRCGQRFFIGFRSEQPTCGVCAPRRPDIDWSRIPRRPQAVVDSSAESAAPAGEEKSGT
jgi:hypothetical protein